MVIALTVLHVLMCFAIIAMVLFLQSGTGEAGGGAGERKTGAIVPANGDSLIEASIGNVSSLIPNITSDSASHEVGDLMYNGLVTLDRDLNVVGELAKSWKLAKDCLTL